MNIKRFLFVILLFFSVNVCFANDDCTENIDFKIVYNTIGGNKIEEYFHNKNDEVSNLELPVPTREGYKFDGWYYDLYLTKLVQAKYINEIEYTQKYYPNGCSSLTTITLYAKWIKDENGENEKLCDDEKKGFYIVYNTVGGKNIEPEFICINCVDGGWLEKAEKDGYEFDGWYYDEEYLRKVDVSDKKEIEYVKRKDENGCEIEGLVNIYAKWILKEEEIKEEKKINYTINYHTDGGAVLSSNSVCDGCGSKTKLQIPKKEGYKFDGWYYDRELNKKVNTIYMEEVEHKTIYSDGTNDKENVVNLYAKWKVDVFFTIKNVFVILLIIVLFIGGIGLILFIYVKKQKSKKEEIESLGL